jgi:hypothetical protein
MPTPEDEPRRPRYQELLAAYNRARETYERDPGPRSLTVLETGLGILIQELHRPGKFDLGQMVMTPGADVTMRAAQQVPPEFLLRHKNGDWVSCRRRTLGKMRARSRMHPPCLRISDPNGWKTMGHYRVGSQRSEPLTVEHKYPVEAWKPLRTVRSPSTPTHLAGYPRSGWRGKGGEGSSPRHEAIDRTLKIRGPNNGAVACGYAAVSG